MNIYIYFAFISSAAFISLPAFTYLPTCSIFLFFLYQLVLQYLFTLVVLHHLFYQPTLRHKHSGLLLKLSGPPPKAVEPIGIPMQLDSHISFPPQPNLSNVIEPANISVASSYTELFPINLRGKKSSTQGLKAPSDTDEEIIRSRLRLGLLMSPWKEGVALVMASGRSG